MAFLLFLRRSFHRMFKEEFPNISIRIPQTIVIGTDEFDRFLNDNNLFGVALSKASDLHVKQAFMSAMLSEELRADLKFLLEHHTTPLAVRSSNILEDELASV